MFFVEFVVDLDGYVDSVGAGPLVAARSCVDGVE
jgi:hypothetical protein